MDHYEHWREDLALGRELGVRALRWGVPWYRVEPLPGEFDWSFTDQVIPYLVEELGITPIVDLMHYGCPFWLRREFASDDYPRAVAAYAGTFASRRNAIPLDVIGLNFYPQWSTQQVSVNRQGRLAWRAVEQDGAGFVHLIEDYWRRYEVPVMVTETSAKGALDVRSRWLATSVAAIRRLREEGVPVLGYTCFPLFTMIDWRYRFGKRPPADSRLNLGLYTLAPEGAERRWQATPLVEQFRSYAADPAASVGALSIPVAAGAP